MIGQIHSCDFNFTYQILTVTCDLDWSILNYDIHDFIMCLITRNAFLLMMSKQINITIGNSSTEDIITGNDTAEELQFFIAEVETYMTYKIASYINMSHFAYACKTEGKNDISRLISETA